MLEEITKKIKDKNISIILPEWNDERILKASIIVKEKYQIDPIIIGNVKKVKSFAKEKNINIDNIKIIDPNTFSDIDTLIDKFYLLRKDKGLTRDDARKKVRENYLYFANMLLYTGYADGVVSGVITTSKDSITPALQIIKAKEHVASSFFLIELDDKTIGYNGYLFYADCALNINPTAEDLVTIAKTTCESFKMLTDTTNYKVAFLSHSTKGSSTSDKTKMVRDAATKFKEKYPNIISDGEIQFDAAIDKDVAQIKCPNSSLKGDANILIFPDLDSANIAYKITERLAHAKAYGPIIQGLKKPVNDLSRGSSIDDIIGVILITAMQSLY